MVQGLTDPTTKIDAKYQSKAAEIYREKLKQDASGGDAKRRSVNMSLKFETCFLKK